MGRIKSVDVSRLIAIGAVIAIHTQPFLALSPGKESTFGELGWVINQLGRFAVPFFFIMAGYFWALKQRGSDQPLLASMKMARRVAIVLIAWSLIYLVPFNVVKMWNLDFLGPLRLAYWNLAKLAVDPLALLGQSTKVHLWFLIALLWALAIAAFLRAATRVNTMLAIGIAFFVFALLGKPYANTPFGFDVPIQLRNGPFFGTVLFATGILLSRITSSPSWLYKGIAVFALGLMCQMTELYVLWSRFDTSAFQDFTIGTFFMGLGFSMVALSNHPILQSERLSAVGQYTLGIYAIHFVFVDMFVDVAQYWTSPYWQVAYPLVVGMLSIGTVLVMARSESLRKIVS